MRIDEEVAVSVAGCSADHTGRFSVEWWCAHHDPDHIEKPAWRCHADGFIEFQRAGSVNAIDDSTCKLTEDGEYFAFTLPAPATPTTTFRRVRGVFRKLKIASGTGEAK